MAGLPKLKIAQKLPLALVATLRRVSADVSTKRNVIGSSTVGE